LQCSAAILSQTNSVLPTSLDTKTVPAHIANILKVILLHDKFDQNFDKWNYVVADDRDVLVLTLKHGAQVDSSLVYTICMMYPFRIHGPLLIKNTMHVEFLHENRLESVVVTQDIASNNIQYALGTCLHQRKRQRLMPSTITSTLPTMPIVKTPHVKDAATAPSNVTVENPRLTLGMTRNLNLDVIRRKLSLSLQTSNNSRVFVDEVTTGFDAAGTWVIFRLSECDKLNLDFFGSFQLSVDDLPVKVSLFLYLSLFFTLSLSLFFAFVCACVLCLVVVPQERNAGLVGGRCVRVCVCLSICLCACVHVCSAWMEVCTSTPQPPLPCHK